MSRKSSFKKENFRHVILHFYMDYNTLDLVGSLNASWRKCNSDRDITKRYVCNECIGDGANDRYCACISICDIGTRTIWCNCNICRGTTNRYGSCNECVGRSANETYTASS